MDCLLCPCHVALWAHCVGGGLITQVGGLCTLETYRLCGRSGVGGTEAGTLGGGATRSSVWSQDIFLMADSALCAF